MKLKVIEQVLKIEDEKILLKLIQILEDYENEKQ